jgi:hypothetical protein
MISFLFIFHFYRLRRKRWVVTSLRFLCGDTEYNIGDVTSKATPAASVDKKKRLTNSVNNEWTELTEISREVRLNYGMGICAPVFTYIDFLIRKWYETFISRNYWPNPSSRTMVLGSTQPLTEMSTRNLPGGKGRPARKADNLTAVCEPIVWIMWDPQGLTTLWASTACYRDSFLFLATTMVDKFLM